MWTRASLLKKTESLFSLLYEQEMVTAEQLEQLSVIAAADLQPVEAVLRCTDLTEQDLVGLFTSACGVPYLPLQQYEFHPATLRLIPGDFARRYQVVALDRIGEVLSVVMADPTHKPAIRELETLTGCTVRVFVCTLSEMQKGLEFFYPVSRQDSALQQTMRLERREALRAAASLDSRITTDMETLQGKTANLSATGACFSSRRKLLSHNQVQIKINGVASETGDIHCRASVIRSVRKNNGYEIALRFECIPPRQQESILNFVQSRVSTV